MGKRRYRQPYWWFNTRLEHMSAGSFWDMFLGLPSRQRDLFHTTQSIAKKLDERSTRSSRPVKHAARSAERVRSDFVWHKPVKALSWDSLTPSEVESPR